MLRRKQKASSKNNQLIFLRKRYIVNPPANTGNNIIDQPMPVVL